MKHVLPLLSLSLAIAAAVPAAAQPLDITVRGGTPAELPSVLWQGDDYVYGFPGNPNGFNYDPAAAAINAINVANPVRRAYPRNISLAATLAFRSGSWADHQAACQARYPSYDWVSDTILVGGLPRRCPLF